MCSLVSCSALASKVLGYSFCGCIRLLHITHTHLEKRVNV